MSTLDQPPRERDLPDQTGRRAELLHLLDLDDGTLDTSRPVRKRWLLPVAAAAAVAALATVLTAFPGISRDTENPGQRTSRITSPDMPGKEAAKVLRSCMSAEQRTLGSPPDTYKVYFAARFGDYTPQNRASLVIGKGQSSDIVICIGSGPDAEGQQLTAPANASSGAITGVIERLGGVSTRPDGTQIEKLWGLASNAVSRITVQYPGGPETDIPLRRGVWFLSTEIPNPDPVNITIGTIRAYNTAGQLLWDGANKGLPGSPDVSTCPNGIISGMSPEDSEGFPSSRCMQVTPWNTPGGRLS